MSLARRFRAVKHKIGRRGAALLCFATLDLVYACSLAFPARDGGGPAARWFATILPLWFWAIWWLSVAAICVAYCCRENDRYGFAAAIGIKIWWGVLSLVGWLLQEVPVSSAGIWLGLAVLVILIAGWPEPEHHVIEEESGSGGHRNS